MQDIFENAKRVANSAVERAAWEADRLRRINAYQRDMEFAQRERMAIVDQLAGVILDLERRGLITQEPLKALASRLKSLDDEVKRAQTEILAIRNETFAPGSISFNFTRQGTDDTMPCPTCGQPVRKSAAFCSSCGARLR
ncbi:MAG: zinc ribbon domain-containing protein [Ktedonobacterales bacterium]